MHVLALAVCLLAVCGVAAGTAVPVCRNDSRVLSSLAVEADMRTMVYDSGLDTVYVPFYGRTRIATVDPATLVRGADIVTTPHGDFLASLLDGTTMYLTTGPAGDLVAVSLTGASPGVSASVSLRAAVGANVTEAFFFGAVLAPAGGVGYFAAISGHVAKVDLTGMTVLETAVLSGEPKLRVAALNPAGTLLFVASLNAGSGAVVAVFHASNLTLAAPVIPFASSSFTAAVVHAPSSTLLLASSYGSTSSVVALSLVAPHTHSTLALAPSDKLIISALLTPDGNTLLLGTDISDSASSVIVVDVPSFSRTVGIQLDSGEVTLVAGAVDAARDTVLYACRGTSRLLRLSLVAPNCSATTECDACNAQCGCGWCALTEQCQSGDPRGPLTALGEPSCPAEAWDYYDCANCLASGASCASCAANPLCGWCAAAQACLRGNGGGPLTPSQCPAPPPPLTPDWEFSTCSVCASLTSCGTCTADPACGWCPATQTCERGAAGGSYTSTCPSWSFASCRAGLCAAAPTCAACAAASPHCGWCSESQSCIEGSAAAPYGAAGTCAAPNGYVGAACPPCAAGTDCANCTALGSGCGWCAATGSCEHGAAGGSYESACALPEWSPDGSPGTCPVCAPASGTDCATCTGIAGCGWCASTSVCASGSAAGSFALEGPASACPAAHWDFGAGLCRDCAARTACSSCAADGKCGWCYADGVCKPGDAASGPFAGHGCGSGTPGAPDPVMWAADDVCPAICANATSCATCHAADPRCGWCASSSTCLPGNATTPLGSPLPACSVWDADCSRCTGHTACDGCTADPGCGFCDYPVTGAPPSCLAGNPTGAFVAGACPLGAEPEPVWFHGTCSGSGLTDPCDITAAAAAAGVAPSCDLCLGSAGCGWCPSTQQCVTPAFSRCSRDAVTGSCPGYSYWYILVLAALLAAAAVAVVIAAFLCLRDPHAADPPLKFAARATRPPVAPPPDAGFGAPAALVGADATPTDGSGAVDDPLGATLIGSPPPRSARDVSMVNFERSGSSSDSLSSDGGGGVPTGDRTVVLNPLPYRMLGARRGEAGGKKAQLLDELARVVGDSDLVLARALCAVVAVSDEGDELASALVTELQADGDPLALLAAVVGDEVAGTEERQSNTLLRANTMASKLMKVVASIEALDYVFLLLRPHLLTALAEPAPVPLAPQTAADDATPLLAAVDAIFERVLTSASVVPPAIRRVAQVLLATLADSPFAHLSTRAVSSFLFLRLLSPALCSPLAYELVNLEADSLPPLTPTARKNLVNVSKVLQAIANQAPFTTRSTHLTGANGYILDAIPALDDFVASLSLSGPDAADDAAARGSLPPPPLPIGVPSVVRTPDAHTVTQARLALLALCDAHEADLRAYLSAAASAARAAAAASSTHPATLRPFDAIDAAVTAAADGSAPLTPPDLVELLVDNHYALTSALAEVTKVEEHEDLAGALVLLFSCAHPGASLRLVKVLAARELRTCTEPNMVLRSFHVAARVGGLYAALAGKSYRTWVLAPTLDAVAASPLAYDIDGGHGSAESMLALIGLVGDLLDRVFNSLDALPVEFRSIAAHLNAVTGARFPDTWFVGPGRFFFTHFLLPGLVAPSGDAAATRVLARVGSIIVHLVNDMVFPVEHEYHRALNEFVTRNIGVMHAFLIELSRIPEGAVLSDPVVPFSDEQEASAAAYILSRIQYYIDNADFCYLYHFYFHYESDATAAPAAAASPVAGASGGDVGGELEWAVMAEVERILRAWRLLER